MEVSDCKAGRSDWRHYVEAEKRENKTEGLIRRAGKRCMVKVLKKRRPDGCRGKEIALLKRFSDTFVISLKSPKALL